jgi:hypothetical protein
MQNMLGDEVTIEPFVFEWLDPREGFPQWHLYVKRGGKFFCDVSPNGWTGHSITIRYPLGEPIVHNLCGNDLSFTDMKAIMGEYMKNLTPRQLLDGCIKALAEEKKMTIAQAIAYIAKKKIECIAI